MISLITILLQSEASKPWLLASEKINSVLAVVLLIFGAILTYLMLTQRKAKQLEKKIEELENQG